MALLIHLLLLGTVVAKVSSQCPGDGCNCYDRCFTNPPSIYRREYTNFYKMIQTVGFAILNVAYLSSLEMMMQYSTYFQVRGYRMT